MVHYHQNDKYREQRNNIEACEKKQCIKANPSKNSRFFSGTFKRKKGM
jgi:hypothetical protein